MRTVPENVTCGRELLSNQWLSSSSPGLRRIFSIAVMQTRCKVQTLKIRAGPKLSGEENETGHPGLNRAHAAACMRAWVMHASELTITGFSASRYGRAGAD